MHDLAIASISSGWAAVFVAIALGLGGFARWGWERWHAHEQEIVDDATKEATAPQHELTAAAQAAAAIATAAAALIAPFQATVTQQAGLIGQLQADVRTSREAEAACQADLAALRREVAGTKSKVREVTDKLGLEPPNGPTEHGES